MNLLYRRPLASGGFIFVLASIAVAFLPIWLALTLLVLCCAVGIILFAKHKKSPAKWGLVAAILLGLALTVHLFSFVIPRQNIISLSESPHTLKGRVIDQTVYQEGQALTVSLFSVDGENTFLRVSLFTVQTDIQMGDIVLCDGQLSPLSRQTDSHLYAMANGIQGEVDLSGNIAVLSHTFSLRRFFSHINNTLSAQLQTVTKGEGGGLFPALLLGNKTYLPAYASAIFRRAGVSHLLALSGLHLTILLAFIQKMLKRAKIGHRWVDVICLGFILFYTVLVGASSSILRAAFMSSFYFVAWFLRRQNDSFTSLFLTAGLLLLFSRGTVYDVGFWLSFFATFAIVLMTKSHVLYSIIQFFRKRMQGKLKKRLFPILENLLQISFITLFATLFTLPLCCLFFGEASLISVPASLLLTPLVNVVLLLALPLLLLSFVPYVGAFLGGLACVFTDALLKIVTWLGKNPHVTVSLNFAGVYLLSAVLILLLVAIPLLSRKWTKPLSFTAISVFLLGAAIVLTGNIAAQRQNYIAYEETAKQDFLLISDEKETALLDISTGNYGASGYALSLLSQHHITYLNRLVLTHLHTGHGDFLRRLSNGVQIGEVYVISPRTDAEMLVYSDVVDMAEQLKIKVTSYEEEDKLSFGQTVFRLWASASLPQNNHRSFAMSLARNGETLILASSDYTYLTLSPSAMDDFLAAQTLILSGHGGVPKQFGYLPVTDATKLLIIPQKDIPFLISPDILSHLDHITVAEETDFTLSFK